MKKITEASLPEGLGKELKKRIINTIHKLESEDDPGTIQTSESYDITVSDENWSADAELMRCPSWYAEILRSVPFSGLFFMADSPEIDPSEDYQEEHSFLELPGWKEVAEDYPFFVNVMHSADHYPIASSGYGYLVIKKDSTPEDPIYRWDGSGMTFDEAFKDFCDLLDSATPFDE